MFSFLVDGSHGAELFEAVSHQWAWNFYKAKYGEDACITSSEWVR